MHDCTILLVLALSLLCTATAEAPKKVGVAIAGLVLLAAVAFDVISKNNLIQLPKFFKKNNTANL